LEYNIHNYKIIQNILERGLDQIEKDNHLEQALPEHNNIRGKNYYK
jgi:hypothetical protein